MIVSTAEKTEKITWYGRICEDLSATKWINRRNKWMADEFLMCSLSDEVLPNLGLLDSENKTIFTPAKIHGFYFELFAVTITNY